MRRPLLFIAPTVPSDSGNGLAMRAGLFLEALAADHDVYQLVVPVAGGATPGLSGLVRRVATRAEVLPLDGLEGAAFHLMLRLRDPAARLRMLAAQPLPVLARYATPHGARAAASVYAGVEFDVVHVMGLYLAGIAGVFLERSARTGRPVCTIDVDNDEARVRRRFGELHRARGEETDALREAGEGAKFARLRTELLPSFTRVFAAADGDLPGADVALAPGVARVVRNAVAVPPHLPGSQARAATEPFTFLLVGTMGYLPNEDAAVHFCREVLPLLRRHAAAEVRVRIVGSSPPPEVRALGEIDGVTVTGTVPDVAPEYRSADAAVSPIRAGGGTRIKILESFAHGVPVVSTTLGAEGLEVEDGRHLLLADGAEPFARACARMIGEPGLATALARTGRLLVEERYGRDGVAEEIREIFRRI
jgi:glycosyltransferase involved in cell wall biosynthesis